jgi:hypothetical protein
MERREDLDALATQLNWMDEDTRLVTVVPVGETTVIVCENSRYARPDVKDRLSDSE